MINKAIYFLFCTTFCLLILGPSIAYSVDVIDTIEEEDRAEIDANASSGAGPQLVNEVIRSISPSKKIFILTNENQSYSRGDFVSILILNQLVCRALVAKTTTNNLSGIKIIKIYNMNLWNQLAKNKEVLVLKGDDSYYNTKDKVAGKADPKSKDKKGKELDNKIQSEDDLFNSTTANNNEDDQSMEENSKRLIKPDNLLGINYGLISERDNTGASAHYGHILVNWGYQLSDNVWGELSAGTNTIRDYPDVTGQGGLDTRLISFSAKLKYTFNAPFYSYIKPYVGYQVITANSPGAGVDDPSVTPHPTAAQLAKELQLVDDLKRSGPIFGVTILRRLVPGWFARFDLGSDLIGGGLALEF